MCLLFGLCLLCLLDAAQCKDNSYCSTDCGGDNRRFLLMTCPQSQHLSVFTKYLEERNSVPFDAFVLVTEGAEVVWSRTDNVVSDLSSRCSESSNKTTVVSSLTVFNAMKQVLLHVEKLDTHHLEIVVLLFSVSEFHSDHYWSVNPLFLDMVKLTDHNKHTVHIFLDSSVSVATKNLYGSSEHSVTYADSTHFNKAFTLDRLINHESLSDSLQAHFLSNGVLATVHNDVNDFYSFSFPSFEEVFGPAFTDLCTSITCPEGFFCSPLHGCVELASSTRARTSSSLSKGDINLREDKFSLGHDDATGTRYTAAAYSDVAHDELSLLQKSSNGIFLSDVIVGELDATIWEIKKPFIKQLIKKGEPALLRNTVVNTWDVIKEVWNMQHVCDHIGMKTLVNVKCSNLLLTFDPDYNAPLKLNISIPYVIKNMTKNSFCSCVNDSGTKCEYKGYYFFGKVPENLKAHLQPNDFLFSTKRDLQSQKQFIWISSKGMITHGHFDQDYNIFVQLVGRKRFTLWSPWQHERMYVYPRIHPLWHKSRINFKDPDISSFPSFSRSQATVVTVDPGDILFIPPYTWHYVETITPSVSLSTWSHDYHMYKHMNVIYGHDHKFDLLKNKTGIIP